MAVMNTRAISIIELEMQCVRVPDSGSGNFCLWNPESGIWNKTQESGIPLRWNPESKFN